MEKIAIIGANEFQNPLILKAKELGYETHVFAWKAGDIGEKTADFFYPISITEKDQILNCCRKINPVGVATIASDLAAITVNYVAAALNLPCNSAACVEMTTNKYAMRRQLLSSGIPTPRFVKVKKSTDGIWENKDAAYACPLPFIVKPTDRSGSRAITKITDYSQLEDALENAAANSFEHAAIAEEYIEGDEYSCECISFCGQHHFLTVTKKYTTGAPHFIETGHMQPSGLTDAQLIFIKQAVFKALDALQIENGASHTEFKITADGSMRIVEIGARMGGDCIGSDLVPLSTGYDFVKMTLDAALGREPDFSPICPPSYAGIRFIFNESDYREYLSLQKKNPALLYRASDIHKNTNVIDSSSRWGFYILRSSEQTPVLDALQQ